MAFHVGVREGFVDRSATQPAQALVHIRPSYWKHSWPEARHRVNKVEDSCYPLRARQAAQCECPARLLSARCCPKNRLRCEHRCSYWPAPIAKRLPPRALHSHCARGSIPARKRAQNFSQEVLVLELREGIAAPIELAASHLHRSLIQAHKTHGVARLCWQPRDYCDLLTVVVRLTPNPVDDSPRANRHRVRCVRLLHLSVDEQLGVARDRITLHAAERCQL